MTATLFRPALRRVLPAVCLALVAAGAGVPEARAQGTAFRLACEPIPESAVFFVEPYNDDDLNTGIVESFSKEMKKLGHKIGPKDRYEIMMDSKIELGRIDGPSRTLGHAKTGELGVEVMVNLWSSSNDSLLSGRRGRETRESTLLIVTATLRDGDSGRPLWRGEARGVLGNSDPLRLGRKLMPGLAQVFGCPTEAGGVP
ncbi:MAG: hypothetical protein QNJ67_14125 [Kiloniellales bacterium]|nr:hypothetical protein [Kiloniellales bacterium]